MFMHVIGTGGAIAVLFGYFLVSTGRVPSSSIVFQGLNLLGAVMLATYAFLLEGWSMVVLNVVWGTIALVAIVRTRTKRVAGEVA